MNYSYIFKCSSKYLRHIHSLTYYTTIGILTPSLQDNLNSRLLATQDLFSIYQLGLSST